MNLKKIYIFENSTLFDVLNEVKEKFNLDIINISKKNLDDKFDDLSSDYLIITKSHLNDYKNQLILNDFPLKINQIIERINLKFLKHKFNTQSDISIGPYKLNLNSREISKDKNIISLTEREINLVLFLKNASTPVKISELQKKVWEYGSELETHTVETHIYRLRKKIKEKFNDDNFIKSLKEGYFIK